MDQLPRISEAVYAGMCRIEGTATLVSIRRGVIDINEILLEPVEKRPPILRKTLSGSRREGFGQLTSDYDFMLWWHDHCVIWDLNHADKYNTERCTLILMEYSENRPGYAMLQLLTPTYLPWNRKSCVRINDALYISSAKFRKNTLSLIPKHSIQHGPCASGRDLDFVFDYAFCFHCKLWPSIATPFTLRCQSKAWPPNQVLRDIINSGCYVVPVGFKGSPQEDCEWRISFSKAEEKLIYCMNHTQFLCYGLLKLFLKEALTVKDTNGQPLLCSYFMKTILFWVIQNDSEIDWTPSGLLSGFRLCLKFLLSCVYHGNLPNFFITENNMFICKVFGHTKEVLYERLFDLYKLGIPCLLHCHSIREYLTLVFYNNQYLLSTAELDITSEVNFDLELFRGIEWLDYLDLYCLTLGHCFASLHSALRRPLAQNINAWQHVAFRKFISSILRCTVYHLYYTQNNFCNKSRLKIMNACLNMLKITTEIGCLSDKIYLCLFLYNVGKNKEAITNLTMLKGILTQSYIMGIGCGGDKKKYIAEVGGLPLSEKMRRAVAMKTKLYLLIIKELELEFRVTQDNFLRIPPYVMTLMLLVLCYRGNPHKQQEALYELYILLHFDDGRFIPKFYHEISWQILGICQQICGKYHEALFSYKNSLKQIPLHRIMEATYRRIQDVQSLL